MTHLVEPLPKDVPLYGVITSDGGVQVKVLGEPTVITRRHHVPESSRAGNDGVRERHVCKESSNIVDERSDQPEEAFMEMSFSDPAIIIGCGHKRQHAGEWSAPEHHLQQLVCKAIIE